MSIQTDFDMVAFESAVTQSAKRPEVVLEFLSEDIDWTEIDHLTPPSSPRRRRGHAEVLEMLRGVADRGIETALIDSLLTRDRAALMIRCRYPHGRIVLEHALIAIRDGRIHRWQGVQAWDHQTPPRLEAFATRVLCDLAGTMTTVLAMVGDRLGLFPALAHAEPMTSAELAVGPRQDPCERSTSTAAPPRSSPGCQTLPLGAPTSTGSHTARDGPPLPAGTCAALRHMAVRTRGS